MDTTTVNNEPGVVATIRLLRNLLAEERVFVAGWAASLVIASVATLAFPFAIRHVIDAGFSTLADINQAFSWLLGIGLLLAAATASRLYFVSSLGDRVVASMRKNLFGQLIARPMDFHGANRSAELLSRLTTDSEHLRMMVGMSLSIAVRGVLMLVGAGVLMLITNAQLAAYTLISVLVAAAPIILSSRKLRAISRESQDRIASANSIATEVLGAVRAVKEFVRESHEHFRYARAIDNASGSERQRAIAQATRTAIGVGLVFGSVIIVLWMGAKDVSAQRMTPGALGQFVFYAIIAGSSVAELVSTWATLQRSVGAVSRLAFLYEIKPGRRPSQDGRGQPISVKGRIAFEDVDFAYASIPDKCVVKRFSLTAEPGQTIALVGPSGAGKSTIFALLMRLFDPQQGRITIDGCDLKDMSESHVREQIATVSQSPMIFALSARDNIRYGRLDASDDEVEAAARAAEADAFIRALPHGYDEPLGERGVRLSGGQQQRIAIARAILKDAPILLLDEATSALDAHSEQLVQTALKRLRAGRTTLTIAHRLSTVRDADHIVVMDNGRVTDSGTHAQLVENKGLYASLAKIQFLAA